MVEGRGEETACIHGNPPHIHTHTVRVTEDRTANQHIQIQHQHIALPSLIADDEPDNKSSEISTNTILGQNVIY